MFGTIGNHVQSLLTNATLTMLTAMTDSGTFSGGTKEGKKSLYSGGRLWPVGMEGSMMAKLSKVRMVRFLNSDSSLQGMRVMEEKAPGLLKFLKQFSKLAFGTYNSVIALFLHLIKVSLLQARLDLGGDFFSSATGVLASGRPPAPNHHSTNVQF